MKMSPEERAKALVGDMPWVTENLTGIQLRDLQKQVATSMMVAVAQERERCAVMTEQEYIDACDMTTLRIARSLIYGICVENQQSIRQEELLMVARTMDKWIGKIYDRTNRR